MPQETVEAFRQRLRGPLLSSEDDGFEEATRLWNGMIERTPALVVQSETADDVVTRVDFVREHDRLLRIRGGGHNVAGTALTSGGLTLDASRMNDVERESGLGSERSNDGVIPMSKTERQDETNAEIANRWVEGCLTTDYRELVDAYAADEFVGYASGVPGPHRGPEEIKATLATFVEGFPDLTADILDSCADDDVVAAHWVSRGTHEGEFMGIDPTGTKVEFESMEFVRFQDGKIVESHVVWDALGLLGQLGVVEPPGE